jgi:hypothetical protein
VLLQLQQVPATRQSAQVPMKHQKKPVALVIGQAVHATVGVSQFEWNRWLAYPTHASDTAYMV